MKILESLQSLSVYPIPTVALQDIAERVGLDINADLTSDIRDGKSIKRSKAYVYLFLSEAPDIRQVDISYSFTDEDRKRFKTKAQSILEEIGDDSGENGVAYGYMGADL